MMKIIVGAAAVSISAGLLPLEGATDSSPRYRVVDFGLGKLPGPDGLILTGLNNRGQISGWRYPRGGPSSGPGHGVEMLGRPFFTVKGKARDLPPLEKGSGHALRINDRGDVVGDSNRFPVWLAVLWKAGDPKPLPIAEGDSRADAINNRGDLLLHRFAVPQADGETRSTNLWWLKTGTKELPIRSPDGRDMEILDLADNGEVAGYTRDRKENLMPSPQRAFAWRDGHSRWLATAGEASSAATALNERREIVGWSDDRGVRRACLWTNDRRVDLGTLGGPSSEALAINEHGLIVGNAADAREMQQACLWQNRQCRALQDLIPRKFADRLGAAVAVNDRGQILTYGGDGAGNQTAFLLTPE